MLRKHDIGPVPVVLMTNYLPPERHRSRSLLAAVAAALFLALLIPGCSRPEPWEQEDPAQALKVFLMALEIQQLDTAWEFLLPEDREVLEARKAEYDELTGGSPPREAYEFLSPGHVVSSPREYLDMRVDEEASTDERTVMIVELHDESTFTVDMIRRDGRWYVDLPLEADNQDDREN